jgi:hypothetical protein
MVATDKVFAGSIPEIYDRFLVPLIFEPYATDLEARVAGVKPQHVLETADNRPPVTVEAEVVERGAVADELEAFVIGDEQRRKLAHQPHQRDKR